MLDIFFWPILIVAVGGRGRYTSLNVYADDDDDDDVVAFCFPGKQTAGQKFIQPETFRSMRWMSDIKSLLLQSLIGYLDHI